MGYRNQQQELQQQQRRPRQVTEKQIPYLLLNLSQDGRLSAYNWSEERGIYSGYDEDHISTRIIKNTYRRVLPPPNFGKHMAKIHHGIDTNKYYEKNLNRTGNNCMNLMFYRWEKINWYNVVVTTTNMIMDKDIEAENVHFMNHIEDESNDRNECYDKHSNTSAASESYSSYVESSLSSLDYSTSSSSSIDVDLLDVDRTETLATAYGPDLFSKMMDNMIIMEDKNIFQDLAMPLSFPLVCIMTYAIQGQSLIIKEILQSLDKFYFSYEKESEKILMVRDRLHDAEGDSNGGKVERENENKIAEELETTFKQSIGWCGWYLYLSFYRMRAFTRVLPITSTTGVTLSEEDEGILLDSIGTVGLTLMRLGFHCENSATQNSFETAQENTASLPFMSSIMNKVFHLIEEEIDMLLSIHNINDDDHLQHLRAKNDDGFYHHHLNISPKKKEKTKQLIKQLLREEIFLPNLQL